MYKFLNFEISNFFIGIAFANDNNILNSLLPSFNCFSIERELKDGEHYLFTMSVLDCMEVTKERVLVRNFDTGNGEIAVYNLPDGGYEYIIRDIQNRDCCLLRCDLHFKNCQCALNGDMIMKSFGLNNALMLAFAFSSSYHSTLLIHASCVRHNGVAYPFVAKSGTGKSTHTSLWMKYIGDTDLLNDDNPIVRIIDGKPLIFGSPWSGKTPCYRNINAPLGAITRIERAKENSIERLKPITAFASLMSTCSSMKWDSEIHNNICNTLTKIIETTPIFTLHCLPDEDAALLCHSVIAKADVTKG